MRIGGIIIGIAGILLFIWHLYRGEMDPAFAVGYASHQVRSVDSIILIIMGAVFYFWGRHRHIRRTIRDSGDDVSSDE